MWDESAEKFQGASGAACMERCARKIINAHGEFVIGLKSTSEPRETFFFQMVHHTYTLLHANHHPPLLEFHLEF
jgi:hypothetical protein